MLRKQTPMGAITTDIDAARDRRKEAIVANRRPRWFRRRLLWVVPMSVLLLAAGAISAMTYWLAKDEELVFEVGSGLRGRFEDFSADFKGGDPRAIASYYAEGFTGSDLGFAMRREVSSEAGILLEEWNARAGVSADRTQMLDQLLAYRGQLNDAKATKFKVVFLNQYSENTANVVLRFQVYAHDERGHPTEDRGHFDATLVRQDGEWRFTKQSLVEGHHVEYPVLLDSDGRVAKQYGLLALPLTIVVDAKGTVRYRKNGMIDAETELGLKAMMDNLRSRS